MADRLYERGAEITAIDSAVSALRTGRGSAVLLEARAGCGKSALVEQSLTLAETAGARTMLARARHLESASPFGVLRRLLGPAVEELGGPAALEGAARFARPLFTPGAELSQGIDYGCQWLVARLAEQSPLALAVDDAHWADAASLRVLLDVQGELSVQPVLLVLASRPVENPEAQRLLAAMAAQPESCVLTPGPLSPVGVAAVLHEHFGIQPDDQLVEECATASGGNAFYLHELLRPYRNDITPRPWTLMENGTVSLVRTVQWRLGELGPDATLLAQAAAVLGDGCSLHVAASLAGLGDDVVVAAAARLEAASILRGGDPVDFLHPLIRGAVEETLPEVSVGELHARAARLLWASGAPPDDVVQHLLASPGSGDAHVATFLGDQGEAALENGSVDVARRLLARALDEPVAHDQRDHLLVTLARAEHACGRLEAARAHLETVMEDADRASCLSAAAELFDVLGDAGEYDELSRLHSRVLAMRPWGETSAEVLLRAQLLANEFVGIDATLPPSPAEIADVDVASLPTARDVDRNFLVMAAIYERTLRRGSTARLVAQLKRAVSSLPVDEALTEWDVYAALMAAAFLADDELEEADAVLDRVAPAVVRLSGVSPALQAELDHRRILNTMRRGNFEEALTATAIAEQYTGRHGLTGYENARRFIRGWVAFERGDHALAGSLLSERSGDDQVYPALGALLSGDPDRALMLLDSFGFSMSPSADVRPVEVEFAPHLIASHAASAAGDRVRAEAEVEREVSVRRAYGPRFRLANALRRQASFTTSRRALSILEEAVELAASTPRRPVRARTLTSYGAALRRSGDDRSARDVLYRALEEANQMGMERLRERCSAELRLAGGRPRRERRTGPSSLTDAQLTVARLAASGRTNREIAEQQYVTIKTVETHLVAVYRKLGVGGRDELGVALIGHLGSEVQVDRQRVARP